ncbi:MAG: ribosomal small subunit protein bTHX [Bacteroidetes bacterium GWF2_38_335]|nr:MAG: ribosomal small subunit protein bTHX [Bacteroidetes bacterium GWF2_38_335]OFY80727.1 MAG: ribosomal small subunit protein bTHX [Bacteroidetes bacterium RIFOXYA12_FULL_38_20]HBS87074.1 30S ribosomal protein THX [Bacteroidales bacterium]
MGKGDIKSKRGKIVNGSYGVRRRKKAIAKAVVAKPVEAETAEVAEKPAKTRKKAK